MEGKYLVAYTLFGIRYHNGFKSFYRHFEDVDHLKRFVNNSNIRNNCIIYEKNMKLIEE